MAGGICDVFGQGVRSIQRGRFGCCRRRLRVGGDVVELACSCIGVMFVSEGRAVDCKEAVLCRSGLSDIAEGA